MAKKVKTIRVRLIGKMADGKRGLIDPANGATISAAKYADGKDFLEVDETSFVRAMLKNDILEEVAKVEAAAPPKDK